MAPDFDIDAEKIKYQGKWRSGDELKQRIKKKVEGGDYDLSSESDAIKDLDEFLEGLEEYTFKLTEEMLEGLEKVSGKSDVGIGEIIRKAILENID